MESSKLITRVEELINERIGKREMFTAWTITCAINNEIAPNKVAHPVVKILVHGFFFKGSMGQYYTRSLVDVQAPRPAWVYHHTADDPNTFQSNTMDAASTPAVVTTASQLKSMTASGATMTLADVKKRQGGYVKDVDQWNRLRLPANILREAQIEADDHVWVAFYPSDTKITVSRSYPSNIDSDTKIKGLAVDGYCNLRLALNGYGLTEDSYEMIPELDKVVVVPVN